jgi:hypothetical protein
MRSKVIRGPAFSFRDFIAARTANEDEERAVREHTTAVVDLSLTAKYRSDSRVVHSLSLPSLPAQITEDSITKRQVKLIPLTQKARHHLLKYPIQKAN